MIVSRPSVDAYLSDLPDDQRAALGQLRAAIHAVAPDADECLSYGRPAFRLGGRVLVAYGAAAQHCALYPMSAATVAAHREALAGHDTSPGTIRFPAARPLPAYVVRLVVEARLAENAELAQLRASRTRARRTGRAAAS